MPGNTNRKKIKLNQLFNKLTSDDHIIRNMQRHAVNINARTRFAAFIPASTDETGTIFTDEINKKDRNDTDTFTCCLTDQLLRSCSMLGRVLKSESHLSRRSPVATIYHLTSTGWSGNDYTTTTFVAIVNPGTRSRISFLFVRCRYLSIFDILLLND